MRAHACTRARVCVCACVRACACACACAYARACACVLCLNRPAPIQLLFFSFILARCDEREITQSDDRVTVGDCIA